MKVLVGAPKEERDAARNEIAERISEAILYDADTFESGLVEQALSGVDMFGATRGVVLRDVLVNTAMADEVLALLRRLPKDAPILLLEESITAPVKRALVSLKVNLVEHKAAKQESSFNIFSLTDAIAGRNKKDAWVLLHEALLADQAIDYILSMVAWQVRVMVVALRVPQMESGMKPFTYNKARRAAGKYSEVELKKLSERIVELQAKARTTDGMSPDLLLEELLLGL